MRVRKWSMILALTVVAVACGDQITEVVPDRDEAPKRAGLAAVPGDIAFAVTSTEDGLSISTDKDDYQPGDTVYLSGAGWQAEDTLDLLLEDEPATHAPHSWWVTVAGDGTFRDSTYVVDVGDLDVTFTLTATSRATGRSLSVQFTDANIGNNPPLVPDTAWVQRGSAANYTLTVSFGGNETPCSSTLSVGGLSSGTSGVFNPATITGHSADTPKQSTLTLTTTASSPLGPDGFTVTVPATASGCTGASRTATGTLIVFGPATKLQFFQQPTNTDATQPITPAVSVRVLDASNNLVANSTATITLAIGNNPAGGTLSGTLTRNAVNGVATFPGLSIDKAGSGYTLAASASSLTGATSSGFAIAVGPAAQLAFFTQPSGSTPNTPFPTQPRVEVQDAGGNRRTSGGGSTSAITLAIVSGTGAGGAALTCTNNPVSASAGLATFAGCRINLAGTGYRLRATSGSLTSVDSDPFDITAVNQPPSVNAGGPYTVAEGTELTLSPTVNDPDNDPLTYQWAVNTTGIDAGGACAFDNANAKNAKVTCTDDSQGAPGGKFTLTLTVNDGTAPAVNGNADLTVTNANPVADAGGPYTGAEGSAIQLGGNGDDPGANDDAQLGYLWTVLTTGIDAGGACSFDNATLKTAKVTCTDDGAFKVRLVVTDDDGGTSAVSEANLTVTNAAPTANAGGPYAGDEGSAIQLAGSGDDVGANDVPHLTYQWTAVTTGIDPGGACTFDDPASKNAKVTCTDDGAFKVRLVVSDDDGGSSAASEADLTVGNVGPVADAGGGANGYSGYEGSPVSLNGSVTDAGANDTHSWSWQYLGTNVDPGASCSFSDPTAEDPTITCTDDGTVKLTLTVTDDDGASSSDDATLTLANVAPTANAGGPYTGDEGAAIQLAGSGDDAGANDVPYLTYQWTAVTTGIDLGGSCSFDNATSKNAKVTCTDDGAFKVRLVVSDDDGGTSMASEANLTVVNVAPVADAGTSYTGNEGSPVQLNGSVTDAGANDTHTWSWQYQGTNVDPGASCSFNNAAAEDPIITCTDDGTVKLTLTVTDDDGASHSDDATLTLANVNPVATAGGPYVGNEGTALSLSGGASDAGTNDMLTQQWTYAAVSGVDAGASCSFSPSATALSPSVTCTDDGVFELTLTVTDDDLGVGTSKVSLTLANLAPSMAGLAALNGSDLPNVLLVGGTLNLRTTFTDLGTNDTHSAEVDCGTGFTSLGASAVSPFNAACTFTTIGSKTVQVRVTDDDDGAAVKSHTLMVKYGFDGFYAPVDRPTMMNVSKAGQAIPLKWRLTDAAGAPITNLATVSVRAKDLSCTAGSSTDLIEEYAAGSSGLQNLGNGNYQFNWKTPSTYASSCKTIELVFGAGALSYTEGPHAYFSFKK